MFPGFREIKNKKGRAYMIGYVMGWLDHPTSMCPKEFRGYQEYFVGMRDGKADRH